MAQEYYFRRQVTEIFGFNEDFLIELETEDIVHCVEMEAVPEPVYPLDQFDRLRVIFNLMNELDVNLAGVEVILEMRENMIRMQQQFNVILEMLVRELKDRLSE
jgi:MerR family transcriptional regulator, heat shock protein HspR